MAVLILRNVLANEQWGVCSFNLLLTFTRSSQVPNHPVSQLQRTPLRSEHNVRAYVSHVSVAPYILDGIQGPVKICSKNERVDWNQALVQSQWQWRLGPVPTSTGAQPKKGPPSSFQYSNTPCPGTLSVPLPDHPWLSGSAFLSIRLNVRSYILVAFVFSLSVFPQSSLALGFNIPVHESYRTVVRSHCTRCTCVPLYGIPPLPFPW